MSKNDKSCLIKMRFLLVFIVFSISNLTSQTISINEVVSSNSQHTDEDGDTPDWLELHNYGTQSVSINNWSLSDDLDNLTLWTFPDITLAPDQYLLIWASDKDRSVAANNLHTNFKISSGSETLTLTNISGTIVDQLLAENLPADTSIGVSKNSGELVNYVETTPGNENSDNEFIGFIESEVFFSNEGGLVNGPVSLMLSGNTAGEEIRYTIGGDMPTETSTLYTNPIQINASTSVKAQLFSENKIPSEVYTKSYILNANHEIDVMLLTVEPADFFDEETGIYVFGPDDYDTSFPYKGANFWEDWERPIHFAYYEKEGNTSVEFNAGVKIHGGASRGNEQKSLSLFARSQYGDSEFEHSFFDEVNYNKFQALLLRNSGNDWLKSSMKDIMASSLMRGSDLDFQEHTPVATYLNGEYWGMYNLREKVNEHMLASKHNIDADDITILEFNGSEVEGSNAEYFQLRSYIRGTDLTIDSNFEFIEQEIDLKEYALYQASQIFFNNTDWPGNNIKYWKHPEGKWRWIMYDTDFGFRDNWSFNTLDWALAENGTGANKEWATLFFRKLVTNIGFRNMFINRYADELNTRFLPSRVNAHIDQVHSTIQPEINRHYQERWGVDPGRVIFYLNEMKTFANNRPAVAKDHLKSQFSLPAYHPLTITNPELSEGSVEVNSNLNIQEAFWSGDYFETVPVQLKAMPKAGFEFSHWSGDISSTEQTISITLVGDLEVTPNFSPSNSEEDIVINEINFKSSDNFDADDWVELYNPNTTAIDISNWELKDDKDTNSFIIPAGTTIDADGYLVLVKTASDFTAVYPEITNIIGDIDFGFGGSDAVRLFDENGSLEDEVVYQSGGTWSDCADETGNTLELISADLNNALPDSWSCINTNGSPNAINSSPVTETCGGSQIVLSTQQDVDAFSSTYDVANCTFDEGIKIEGAAITNLNGLSGLTIVNGSFDISDSPALNNISGLSALSIVGGDLQIYNNAALENLNNLSSLTSVGGNMFVSRNEALTDLSGFSALTTVGGGLNISRNNVLSDCDIAFICDASVVADVTNIYQNTGNCIDLATAEAACTFVPLICPSDQVVLTTQQEVDDFSSIYDAANCTFDDGISIEGADIINLNGLSGLMTVNGRLEISNNPVLTDISGLSSLSSVGGNLSISTNVSLENLNGLALLTTVVGNVLINKNTVLTDLSSLTQLTSVNGGINISKNPVLSNCEIAIVCDATVVAGDSNIYSNAGDCTDLAAAEAACSDGSEGIPIVDAGENQIIVLPITSSAIFNGTANDPDGGTIVSFEWTQTAGPDIAILSGENTATLEVTGLLAGSYVFMLTVTDDQDETGFDEVVLEVQSGGFTLPVVSAGLDQNSTETSITLNGSGSDPDGGDVVFLWTQEDGPSTANLAGSDTAELTATNLIIGEYLFKLTVTDDENETSFDEVTVTITDENPVLTCPTSQVVLTTQQEVDDFSSIYDAVNCTFDDGISVEGVDISNLNGLSGLQVVNGRLEISNNPILTDISGLSSLSTVGQNLTISTNVSLENLNSLALLTTVGGNMLVNKNTLLTDLIGLTQLTSVAGGINISKNPVLSNCEIALVCDATIVAGDTSIYSNTGNCVDLATAEAACSTEPEQRPFITTWKTDNEGESNDNQITIPGDSWESYAYNYNVEWGDGTSNIGVTGTIIHTYDFPGTYQVSITGDYPKISFGAVNDDKNKIIYINQWGDIEWETMEVAFNRCENLDVLALDTPDLSKVESIFGMFADCESLVGNSSFNSWDVSNVEDMMILFVDSPFNQDISDWDVRNVKDMSYMFQGAYFNQDISTWDVSGVENMSAMFLLSKAFNQDLSAWDVSNVTEMSIMFSRTLAFNQDLSAWDVSNVTTLRDIFSDSKMTTENYDKTLQGWSNLPNLKNNVALGATNITYCEAEEARQKLIDDFGWVITDSGKADDCDDPVLTCSSDLVVLTTQQEVDAFATTYDVANCTFEGGISIEGTDIVNLDGLSGLTTVSGPLSIVNTGLINLQGLSSLMDVGDVLIDNNSVLTSLDGLSLITSAVNVTISNNELLSSMGGLSSLSNASNLIIQNNASLPNLDGLSSLESIYSTLIIQNNASLMNLDGLSSLESVSDDFKILNNASLLHIDGLSSFVFIDDNLIIESNPMLENLDGLSSLDAVGKTLSIQSNAALTNLDGLSAITNTYFSLLIINNDLLTNLNGLANLNSVGIDFNISGNNALSDCAIDAVCDSDIIVNGNLIITENAGNCADVTVAKAACADSIWLEAECAIVGADWTVISDVTASNGEYVLTPSGNNYSGPPTDSDEFVTFDFQADGGTYNVHALVQGNTVADDSFWVRANGGIWVRWNGISLSSTFVWDQVHDSDNGLQPVSFELVSGANTLDFAMREDGVSLDKVHVTSTSNLPNGLGGESVNCVIVPEPPIVDAGASQNIILPITSVVITGSANDPDGGAIVSYEWTQEDGPSIATLSGSNTPELTASILEEGAYVFRLTVTDDEGDSGLAEVIVTVGVETTADSIWLEAECADVGADWTIVSDITASNGEYVLTPSGNNYSGPPTDSDEFVTFDFQADGGTYNVHALVQGNTVADDSFWVRANGGIWVRWNGISLSSTFVWDQVHDSDNGLQPVSFELVSGANTLDFAMREDGVSLDKVHVTSTSNLPNGLGGESVNCVIVPEPPIVDAGASQNIILPITSVVITGSANDPDGGAIVSYEWTQEDGPSIATLSGSNTPELTASILEEGAYVFRLTVTDDEGDSGLAEVIVTVGVETTADSIWLEAECADVGADWTIVSDITASNGEYVLTPSGNNYSGPPTDSDEFVTFDFQADGGTYNVHALVQGNTVADDSFWVRANGGIWVRWNGISLSSTFVWDQVHDSDNGLQPVSFELVSGANTLDFAMREDGVSLDKVHVTSTSNLPNGLGGESVNCSSDVNIFAKSISAPNQMTLFPNPAKEATVLSFEEPAVIRIIYVYDVLGRLLQTISAEEVQLEENYSMDMRGLPSGTYFVKTYDDNGIPYQQQMIIER